MQHGPISFPDWKQALARASLAPAMQAAYQREILTFLRHCQASRAAATVAVAKQFLAWRERQSSGPAREALRWFYREGARQRDAPRPTAPREEESRTAGSEPAGRIVPSPPEVGRPDPSWISRALPPPAAGDLGAEPWERELIRAIREKGFLWRTEQTYREWAVRFARFLAPRSPHAASGAEVAAFLSALAVEGRASASAQKQALNALVFLMQEALHRELGEMDFRRAASRRRVPTILSQGECKALFAQLEGTPRLMVELALTTNHGWAR